MQSMQLFSSSHNVFSGEIRSCFDTSLSFFRTFVQLMYKQDMDVLTGGEAVELKVYPGSRGNKTSSAEISLQRAAE